MGTCMSAPSNVEVSEEEKMMNKEVEKQLKEVRNIRDVVRVQSILLIPCRPRPRWRLRSRLALPLLSYYLACGNTFISRFYS
jgi:hypothetical protein